MEIGFQKVMLIKTMILLLSSSSLQTWCTAQVCFKLEAAFSGKAMNLGNTFITIPALERFLGKIKCLKAKLYPVSELPR